MTTPREIDQALYQHGLWKKRLEKAIESGDSSWTADQVGNPHICEFGKWFDSLSEEDKKTATYKEVEALHSRFHQLAADILKLAVAGEKDKAKSMIEFGSEFRHLTSELTIKLAHWGDHLGANN